MLIRFGLGVLSLIVFADGEKVSAQFPAPVLSDAQEIVVEEDFDKPHELKKSSYLRRQGTRWTIESGVLRGRPSTEEYQASHDHHRGYEPRLSMPTTPQQFQARFSIRFIGGKETAIAPFIEFGHHVCRVRFSKHGLTLLADGETMKLAESTDFKWKSGQWYHVTAEMVGSEFVFQIKDGPSLYANWKSFAKPPKSGGSGLGVAGPKGGMVEIEDLRIAKAATTTRADWEARRKQFPLFDAVQIKEPKKKK